MKANRFFYGWVILAVSCTTIIVVYSLRYNFSIFYIAILDDFGWSRAATAGVFSINLIFYAISAPFVGGLVDRFGIRRILPVGAVLFGVLLIGCLSVNAIWQLYLLFALAGITTCLVGYVPCTSTLPNWFIRRRGLALGIATSALTMSTLLAPLIGYLVSTIGWRATYFVFGISLIVIVAPLNAALQRHRPEGTQLNAHVALKEDQHDNSQQDALIVNQAWVSSEWTLRNAAKTRQFWYLVLAVFFCGIWCYGILTHQVACIKEAGYSMMLAAGLVSLFGVLATIGSLCNFISDRIGREITYALASSGAIIGAIMLLFLMSGTLQPWLPYAYAVIFGFSYGLASPLLVTVGADLFSGKHFGAINGFVMGSFVFGGGTGAWLMGHLFDITGGYTASLLPICFAIVLSAIFMCKAAPRKVRMVPGKLSQRKC